MRLPSGEKQNNLSDIGVFWCGARGFSEEALLYSCMFDLLKGCFGFLTKEGMYDLRGKCSDVTVYIEMVNRPVCLVFERAFLFGKGHPTYE